MKKLTILLTLIITILSCKSEPVNEEIKDTESINLNSKSAYELETDSINFGTHIDTISSKSRAYIFGMTKEDVYNRSQILLDSNQIIFYSDTSILYRFNTENYILSNRVNFNYYKGKLYQTTESVVVDKIEKLNNKNTDFRDEVLTDIKQYYNEPLTNGRVSTSQFYWLKGNLRIDYIKGIDNKGDSTVTIAYTNMITERIIYDEKKKIAQEELQKEIDNEIKIKDKLKTIASKNWPDNYSTQEYWINEQLEAYRYMKTIPEDRIKKKAERNWPYNFSTQKYWYHEQIEARERLK